jgi:hypothetical protein
MKAFNEKTIHNRDDRRRSAGYVCRGSLRKDRLAASRDT